MLQLGVRSCTTVNVLPVGQQSSVILLSQAYKSQHKIKYSLLNIRIGGFRNKFNMSNNLGEYLKKAYLREWEKEQLARRRRCEGRRLRKRRLELGQGRRYQELVGLVKCL